VLRPLTSCAVVDVLINIFFWLDIVLRFNRFAELDKGRSS
jgi:hypothetical protein